MARLRLTSTVLLVAAGLAACSHGSDTATSARAAAAAPGAAAAAPAPSATTPAQSGAAAQSGPEAQGGHPGSGVRVFLDPVTGEAREPTRAEAAAGAAAEQVQAQSAGGQTASEGGQREHFVLPDGTEGVTLAPRDRRSVVVCRQTDGSYSENCPPATGGAPR